MKDTKLIELLKNLNKDELKEFEKFVSSPYFSRGRDVLPLLKSLKVFYPEFKDEKLTDNFLIKNLFKEKKSDADKNYSLLKTLTSELFKLGKEFLAYSEFSNDQNRKNFYLLNQLRKKKLYKEFEKEYKTSAEYEQKNDTGNSEDFLNKYFLYLSLAEYSVETGDFKQAYESIFMTAEYSAIVTLIRAFRLTEMKEVSKNFCRIETGFNLAEFLIENLDEEKFIKGIEINEKKYFPLIKISYLIHKMTAERRDNSHYFKLKKLFFTHLDLMGQSEKYMLFGIMGSYCISMLDDYNKDEFRNELFEIYEKSIELNAYKWRQEDDFPLSLFRNIVLTATGNDKLEWLENFILKYSGELNFMHRDNMKYYSLAYLFFSGNNYEKALENLIKVKYDFFLFKSDVRNLYIRIYYEMDHTEQCYSVLDSMKHYLNTTKDLNEFFKKRFFNFVKYSSELLRMKVTENYSNASLLKKRIENEEHVELRRWLIAKAQELEKLQN
jgi:hypothetical protein